MPVTMDQIGDEGPHLGVAVFLEAFSSRIAEKGMIATWIAAISR